MLAPNGDTKALKCSKHEGNTFTPMDGVELFKMEFAPQSLQVEKVKGRVVLFVIHYTDSFGEDYHSVYRFSSSLPMAPGDFSIVLLKHGYGRFRPCDQR